MVKIKADKTTGMKAFEVNLKDLGIDDRATINDMIIEHMNSSNGDITSVIPPFSYWLKIVRLGTDYTDDELNQYTNDELIAIASKIIEKTNKKK